MSDWSKVLTVLKSCPSADLVPSETFSLAMTHACKHPELIEDVLELLVSISTKKDPGADPKVY